MRFFTFGVVAFTAILATGCSGGGGGGGIPGPSSSPTAAPVLVAGSVRHYTATESISHVYASPGPNTTNFTESYTIAQTTNVNAAAAGSPGAFDVNTVVTYTTVQPPLAGDAPISSTTDSYENQTQGSSTVITEPASHSVVADNDVSANAAGGGPYTLTTTTTTDYSTPETLGTYPLVAGTTYTQAIGRTAVETLTLANAGGAAPPSSVTYATNESTTYDGDGSYTRTEQLSNGESETLAMLSNGTASLDETGPVLAEQESIGAPTGSASGEIVPVSITKQTNTQNSPTTNTYGAADWYPGGGQPAVPFDLVTITVKGPATSLPSGCNGAATEPNIVEVDQNETNLSLFGSLAVTQQQAFNSNGVNVCVLRTVTTTDYSIETGLQTEVSAEQYAQILTSLTTPASKLRSIH